MKFDPVQTVAIVVIGMIACVAMLSENWNRIEAEKNAFAKDCNYRGGRAEFTIHGRQCIGATLKKDDAR